MSGRRGEGGRRKSLSESGQTKRVWLTDSHREGHKSRNEKKRKQINALAQQEVSDQPYMIMAISVAQIAACNKVIFLDDYAN